MMMMMMMKQNAKTLHKNGKWSISLLSKGAYYELWNNALTPLLGIKQIERDWKGKQTNKNHHLGKKENKIPFSEFSSLAVSGSSAGGNAEESMTRGGFTCGLSHSVLSLISKNFHFFSFACSHSCWTCLSLVYIFVATFSFYSPDLALCNF